MCRVFLPFVVLWLMLFGLLVYFHFTFFLGSDVVVPFYYAMALMAFILIAFADLCTRLILSMPDADLMNGLEKADSTSGDGKSYRCSAAAPCDSVVPFDTRFVRLVNEGGDV
jgi:hypothetical protein